MKKIIASLIFIFLCALTSSSQTPTPTPADDNDVVKISTTLIQVDVAVTDNKGSVIKNLKAEDFEIYENGKKQEITNFSFIGAGSESNQNVLKPKTNSKSAIPLPPTAPIRLEQVKRTIALVVDDLTMSFESTNYVKRALKKFVDEQMQNGDLVAIIRTGGGIGALQQFTSDKRQLYAAIEKVRWNLSGSGNIGAFAAIETSPLEEAKASGLKIGDDQLRLEREFNEGVINSREDIFAAGTLGAVNYIIRGMRELPGRKSVMLLSDGFQLFSKDTNGSTESTRVLELLRRLVDIANRSSVVIYTMDARGLQIGGFTAADNVSVLSSDTIEQRLSDRREKLFNTQDGLIYLAKQTGGFSIIDNNDLSGGIRKILDDQSYYLIGYQPDTDTFDPKTRRFNKLQIKVIRKDTNVRYRSGFFGISDEQIKKPVNQTPYQQIMTALSSPFAVNDISLRLNTLYGNAAKQGDFVSSLLHIDAGDLKFTDEANGSKKAVFDLLAISFGASGLPDERISKTYTLVVKSDQYQRFLSEGFVYYFTFPVKKPGGYQYRVAIRDTQTQKVGSASQFIEVPNLKKNRLTLSGLLLENLTAEQWQKNYTNAPTPTNAPANSADDTSDPLAATSLRRFKRGTFLRYGYEIYNAKLDAANKPNLNTQVRMFRDGKITFEGKMISVGVSAATDLERIKIVGAINLGSSMPAGDYVLQIVVTDVLAKEKSKIAAQFVQFEIVE